MAIVKMMMSGLLMVIATSAGASEKVKNIEAKLGQEVSFSVESNPSTGYEWMIKSLPDELIFVSSYYEQSSECKKRSVGCSGKETFNFIAQKSGKGELKLIHGRVFDESSWEETTVKIDIR